MNFIQVALPILCLAINALTQIIVVNSNGGFKASVLIGLATGLVSLMLIELGVFSVTMLDEQIYVSVFTYLTFSFCFWAFLNLNITSLRIRIITELNNLKSPSDLKELLQGYSESELYDIRIRRLVSGGHLRNISGNWVLQSKRFLTFAYVSVFLKKMIIPAKYRQTN